MEFVKGLNFWVIFSAIGAVFFILYFTSCNNFGQFNQPNLERHNSSHFGYYNVTASSKNTAGVDDELYVLKLALDAASTKEKTVILSSLNEAWAAPNSIFDLFLESFRIGNNTSWLLNHLLVIAVDDKAYDRCKMLVTHCYFLKTNESSTMANEAKFMTPVYLEMMWRRLLFLQTVLSLGYNFVFTVCNGTDQIELGQFHHANGLSWIGSISVEPDFALLDTDVMWFRNPFPHFTLDSDFQTSCDQFTGKEFDIRNAPNNGFLFVRSNNRTIKFYKFWVDSRHTYPTLHEQNVFNNIKNSTLVREMGVKFRFMSTDYFGGFCTPSKDFNKVCTMHANCCVGLDKKIVDLNATLEDWKLYLSSYHKISQPFHWSVPQQCHM